MKEALHSDPNKLPSTQRSMPPALSDFICSHAAHARLPPNVSNEKGLSAGEK